MTDIIFISSLMTGYRRGNDTVERKLSTWFGSVIHRPKRDNNSEYLQSDSKYCTDPSVDLQSTNFKLRSGLEA